MVEPDSHKSDFDAPVPGSEPLSEAQLRKMAFRDALTGLLNRRGFDRELHRVWKQAQHESSPVGMLIIDIDHFKSVNDSYGHPVGDQVLKECAQLLKKSVRASDFICRYYGGDELVAILPGLGMDETRRIADRMLQNFREMVFSPSAHYIQATISIGGDATTPKPGQSVRQFLIQTDQALYRAKQTGRDRVCFAEELLAHEQPDRGVPLLDAPAGTVAPTQTVLVVDDDPTLCALFSRILSRSNFSVLTAESGQKALEAVQGESGMIDVALVDLHLGEENGLELLTQLREFDESMIGVVITGQATLDDAVGSMRAGVYDFIQKPVSPVQLTAVLERATKYRRLVLENKRYQLHLEDMVREKSMSLSRALGQVQESYQFTLEAMAAMLDAREQRTGAHSKRVSQMASILANKMGASTRELEIIQTGALLHDIGKIAIPDHILLKEGPLTPDEMEIMKTHSKLGYDIIKAGPGLEEASEIVLQHQERFDGKGYPRGLKADEISLGARIFAVVDAYDAIRSDRPYSKGQSAQEAVNEIVRHRGTQFDPEVVDALLRCQKEIAEVGPMVVLWQ